MTQAEVAPGNMTNILLNHEQCNLRKKAPSI
jgi:hypothetical protein